MKRLFSVLVISIALTGLVSCDDDDDDIIDPNVVFTATLDAAQETGGVVSTETGNATLTFNTVTKVFTITVTHTIDAPTNGHVHKGAVGVSGPPVFPFAAPFTSPINYTSPALSAAEEADLMANLYYVNIHTDAYPAGEIRGQLIKQ